LFSYNYGTIANFSDEVTELESGVREVEECVEPGGWSS